jgi:hypothetical protein
MRVGSAMGGAGVLQRTGRGAAGHAPSPAGSGQQAGQGAGLGAWPWAAVAGTVAWSLWELRASVLPAQFRDDSAVHEQMVRFAAAQLRAGRDPLTSWFPYLGLGSPQFLDYQSTRRS